MTPLNHPTGGFLYRFISKTLSTSKMNSHLRMNGHFEQLRAKEGKHGIGELMPGNNLHKSNVSRLLLEQVQRSLGGLSNEERMALGALTVSLELWIAGQINCKMHVRGIILTSHLNLRGILDQASHGWINREISKTCILTRH